MTSRFDVERAVVASDLTSSERLLMLVLATHSDNTSATISPKFAPSLTAQARETAMDKSTVQRTLRKLEAKGWLTRQAPSVERSRKGARTGYQLTVPVGASAAYQVSAPRTYPEPGVGAQDTQGRCVVHLPVGAQDTQGRCVVHPKEVALLLDDTQSTQRARADDETAAVIEAVRDRTGKIIDQNFAKLVIINVLGNGTSERPGIKDRIGYLVKTIRSDPDPATRFLPTGQPPPVHEVLGINPRKART